MAKSIQLNIRLEGKSKEKFEEIVDFFGLKSSAEVLRMIINAFYREWKAGKISFAPEDRKD